MGPYRSMLNAVGITLLSSIVLDVRSANLMELSAALPRHIGTKDHRYQYVSRVLSNSHIDCAEIMQAYAGDVFTRLASNCIFRDIRPPIPTTSAHLYRGIRPALTRCREALVFDISFLAFRHVVEGLSFGRIVRRVRAGRRCAPAGRGWHLRRWVHQ